MDAQYIGAILLSANIECVLFVSVAYIILGINLLKLDN